ncbi:MAG TPA: YjjG family noncanonical pyrimidine nucleotidase [Lentimicrobium sp.]|nr:YjjG family noncanonical pyrimidine nucleotidase [Lentimicrobium sp.]
MKTYTHIFFDLDRTLWDFDRNSSETFMDIHQKYDLPGRGVTDFDDFMNRYHKINLELWEHYRQGTIEKEVLNVQRFSLTLDTFGISDNNLCESIAKDYIEISPTKRHLFPGTGDILKYLSEKYTLHIITNGFEEVQHRKLESSGLRKYFTEVITSEDAGYKKPDINIFNYAFDVTGANPANSLMIGDDVEVDVIGARDAGMDQVLVDHHHKHSPVEATYYVTSLEELAHLL